ncbi:MAG: response regulator [Gaiellaceae bacterium]
MGLGKAAKESRRAVVCDDDPVVCRIVTAVLQRCGYREVEQTPFATVAVDLAEAMQPDLIVLDLNLDGESGLDAIPELRTVAPGSRIVVYSGSGAMKGPARRAGAHAVLNKVSMASVGELERVVTDIDSE